MGTSFDYFVDCTVEGGKFVPWRNVVPSFKYEKDTAYTAILVPTEDTTRFSYLMRTLITVDKPVFVTGMTGTGKTVMVQNLLRSLEPYPDEGGLAVVPTFMNFSAQTLSLITQQAIESKLEKKRKNLLGAPAGKKCIFFVDDINMPLVRARRPVVTRGRLPAMSMVSFWILSEFGRDSREMLRAGRVLWCSTSSRAIEAVPRLQGLL